MTLHDNAVEMNEKDGHTFPSRKTEDEILRIDCASHDKEDKKMLKLALKRLRGEKDELVKDIDSALYPSVPSLVKSKHVTGSARSEGYCKIDPVDKKAYLQDSLPYLATPSPRNRASKKKQKLLSRSNQTELLFNDWHQLSALAMPPLLVTTSLINSRPTLKTYAFQNQESMNGAYLLWRTLQQVKW